MHYTTEQDERVPPPSVSSSQPLPALPLAEQQDYDESDDPEQIFVRAVAEIDTQPLPRQLDPFTAGDVLDACLLLGIFCLWIGGTIWQCLTYPHMLVILYAKITPATLTTTLSLPTTLLAPVTLTRSATLATTGTGHQQASRASGTLTFYNGSATPQYVPGGSVFTGTDGVQVATAYSVTIPSANLPAVGSITIPATALLPGQQGNIATWDINRAQSPDLKVRNEAPFTHGRDARTYRAVATADLEDLTAGVTATLTQAWRTAFAVPPDEQAIPTACHRTTNATHAIGEEATSLTVTLVQTCAGLAYQRQQLERLATAALSSRTRPGAQYHLTGPVQTTIDRVSPLTVTISGRWVYTFSPAYQQFLAANIAGKTPTQAREVLLRTGVIASASIAGTLPADDTYVDLVVLIN